MAFIKFGNSYDLINYLCKEEVLGELEVYFSQERSEMLEPRFNFYYPALAEHLYQIFCDWPEFFGQTSKVLIKFQDAEDYDVTVEDDLRWSDSDLSKDIYQYLQDQISYKYEKETYVLLDIEGTDFVLEKVRVNKFEVYTIENQAEPIKLEESFRNKLLNGIFDLLRNTDTCVMDMEEFYIQNTDGFDKVNFCVSGAPDAYGFYDLQDEESFILDTKLLKK